MTPSFSARIAGRPGEIWGKNNAILVIGTTPVWPFSAQLGFKLATASYMF
jgi:hypothetical protein